MFHVNNIHEVIEFQIILYNLRKFRLCYKVCRKLGQCKSIKMCGIQSANLYLTYYTLKSVYNLVLPFKMLSRLVIEQRKLNIL